MSSTNAPFGLRPAYHPSGLDRAVTLADGIASAYNTAILKGQPVKLNTSGNIVVAAAGDSFQGAFAGVQWTDTTGRRRVCLLPRLKLRGQLVRTQVRIHIFLGSWRKVLRNGRRAVKGWPTSIGMDAQSIVWCWSALVRVGFERRGGHGAAQPATVSELPVWLGAATIS